MCLVDHHEAEVRENVSPTVVMGKDSDVEHVGVREDHVRPLADLPAALRLRIAVVDRGTESFESKRAERPGLILRERLRRVEVERAVLRIACERVEDGQVEGERLARRGSRGDDQVLAAGSRVPGGALVRVERVDPDGVADAWVELVRERREPRLARGLGGEVCELLALQQGVPRGDRHRTARSASGTG